MNIQQAIIEIYSKFEQIITTLNSVVARVDELTTKANSSDKEFEAARALFERNSYRFNELEERIIALENNAKS
jgi:hypothetical protein